jgi:hypothetical protein
MTLTVLRLVLSAAFTLGTMDPSAFALASPRLPPLSVQRDAVRELRAGGQSRPEAKALLALRPLPNGLGWRADLQKVDREAWCGSAGCQTMLWLANAHGQMVQAFNDNAGDLRVLKHSGVIDVQVKKACAKTGICEERWRWSVTRRRLIRLS